MISTTAPYRLSDVLRDFKKFTAFKILEAIQANSKESRKGWMLWIFRKAGEKNNRNKEFQFWQQDNHPIECDTNDIIDTRLIYIHENPIRAGVVRYEQDYAYSSAIDYYTEGKGLIEIDRV